MIQGYVCKKCKGAEKQQKQSKISSNVSLGFIYQLSLKLNFPFQAISILIDCARQRQAQNFQIKIVKLKDADRQQIDESWYDYSSIIAEFDGSPFSLREFNDFTKGNSTDEDFQNFILQLKISTLSLGKAILVISCEDEHKMVNLFSVDDRINPQYYKCCSGYSYIENTSTGKLISPNYQSNKQLIMKSLKLFPSNPQKLLQCKQNQTKILILSPKIFVTSSKVLYLMISESNYGHDLDIYHHLAKVQFLENIGYNIKQHAQISFSNYYRLLYRSNPLSIRVGETQQLLQSISYEEELKSLEERGVIEKLQSKQIQGVKEMILYEVKDEYFPHNNGILLYHNGRMINRLQNQLGKMFEQCFYKKKYRDKPTHIWRFLGIIQLEISPNLLKNAFKNTFKYRYFYRSIMIYLESIANKKQSSIVEDSEFLKEFSNEKLKEMSFDDDSRPKKKVLSEKEYPQDNQ